MDTPASPRPAVESALERLQASRERLQASWQAAPGLHGPPGAAAASGRHGGLADVWHRGGLARLWRHWRRRLARVPGIDMLLTAARAGWEQHPWRKSLLFVRDELPQQLTPVLRRHPTAVTVAAAAAGAAVVLWQPWRQPRWRRRARAWSVHLARWMTAQLQHVPWAAVAQAVVAAGAVGAAARAADAPRHAPAGDGQAPPPPAPAAHAPD